MDDNLTNLEKETNKLCEARMKLVKLNKTEPWDKEDLLVVLKKLGKYKSRDAGDFLTKSSRKELLVVILLKLYSN